LRSLSQRELSQNTGLPESDAEHMRMRDFDELFFFAGATDQILRILPTRQNFATDAANLGQFWSLSVGADIAKCIASSERLRSSDGAHLLRGTIAAGKLAPVGRRQQLPIPRIKPFRVVIGITAG